MLSCLPLTLSILYIQYMSTLKVWNLNGSQRVRSLELNTTGENILSWFEATFPKRQKGGQSKTHGERCLGGAVRHEEVWCSTWTLHVRVIEILTGTRFGSAVMSLSPIPLTVFAPQLWHGSIAVSDSGDLPLSTGHRAGGPRRPQTPPTVLANWASNIKHIRRRPPKKHVMYFPSVGGYRHVSFAKKQEEKKK